MLMDMVHEDEVLASVVAASIDDIIKGDDAVTKEMDEFEQALAQSVLDQNATNRTASTTSHQSSSIRGDHDVLNDEDDELRRAIEASLSA
jgi:hypothetical protein